MPAWRWPPNPSANRAQRRVTSLIRPTPLYPYAIPRTAIWTSSTVVLRAMKSVESHFTLVRVNKYARHCRIQEDWKGRRWWWIIMMTITVIPAQTNFQRDKRCQLRAKNIVNGRWRIVSYNVTTYRFPVTYLYHTCAPVIGFCRLLITIQATTAIRNYNKSSRND